jgi:hypothetical protein
MLDLKNKGDFDIVKNTLIQKKLTFFIDTSASSSYIVMDNKKRASYKTGTAELSSYFKDRAKANIISTVHGQVYRFIREHGLEIEKVIPEYPSQGKNFKLFRELEPGTELAYIDIKHAYWRVAFILGYISKSTYKKYANDPEYKLGRNVALSTLVSKKRREVYIEGKYRDTIHCNKNILETVYSNIRYKTYNIIGELAELLGDGCFLYRVDGLLSLYDMTTIMYCRDYFKKENVLFDVVKYIKKDDSHILNAITNELKKI